MNKLIEQIDKLINKKGSLKTPAYYIRGLLIDIVNYFEKKINSFNAIINNINKKVNTIKDDYFTKEEGQAIKTDVNSKIMGLNSSLMGQINLYYENAYKRIVTQLSDIYFINNYYYKNFAYLTSSIFNYTPLQSITYSGLFNFELYFGTLIPVDVRIKIGNYITDGIFTNAGDNPLVKHYEETLHPDNIDNWFQKDIVITYTPRGISNATQKTCETLSILAFIYLKTDNFSKVIYVIKEQHLVWEYKITSMITYITLDESSRGYNYYKYTLDGVELNFKNNKTIQLENFKVDSILRIERL